MPCNSCVRGATHLKGQRTPLDAVLSQGLILQQPQPISGPRGKGVGAVPRARPCAASTLPCCLCMHAVHCFPGWLIDMVVPVIVVMVVVMFALLLGLQVQRVPQLHSVHYSGRLADRLSRWRRVW